MSIIVIVNLKLIIKRGHMKKKKVKLSPSDMEVYKFLLKRESMKSSDIAKIMGKKRSNTSRSITKLRAKNMIEEFRASDRREIFYAAKEIKENDEN